jgi:Immunity protein Imm1
MYITRLIAERLDLRGEQGPSVFLPSIEIVYPTWDQIEESIRELDGNRSTLVRLVHDEDDELAIGGGKDGMYVCTRYSSHGDSYLVDETHSSTDCHQLVVGQVGEYPDQYIVDLKNVFIAARTYSDRGVLDESLSWE